MHDKAEAMRALAVALVAAQEAGVCFSEVSDDPRDPFISIGIIKEVGEQYLTWAPISPGHAIRRVGIKRNTASRATGA